MKLFSLLILLFAVIVSGFGSPEASSTTKTIFIQSIATQSAPIIPLAEVQYDPSNLSAEFVSFEAPDLSSSAKLVRVGVYDRARKSWTSSTSVTSAKSFSQGYAPTIIITLDTHGDIFGVTCKSSRVDAGQTRDFGPKVKVVRMIKGKTLELNRPVVATKDGSVDGEEPEKTMFQKYWWVAAAAMLLLLATGGGDK